MNKSTLHFKLIAGLGNPGKKYLNTYHNIGCLAVDFFASKYCADNEIVCVWEHPSSKRFAFFRCKDVVLIKPTVFMNESGSAIKEAIAFFKITRNKLAVIHDENDIPVGLFKISKGKNAAGHHGVESVCKALGTNDFTRVRIGIQKKQRVKAGAVVLSVITKSELELFYLVFAEAIEKLREKK